LCLSIRGAESAEIVGSVPQHLALTALGGSVATDASGIEAEISLFRTYDDLLAAAPGSLNGKIAVVTQRMARVQDGSGYGAANPIRRNGPSEAAKRGAVAYLLRSLGTDSHRLPHTGALNYEDRRAADSGGGAGHSRRRAARAVGGAGSGKDPASADTDSSRERAVLECRRRDQGYNPAGRLSAIGRANSKAPNQQHAHDGAAADGVHPRTSYSNSTPSGSFSSNHLSAASRLANTLT
jgi:hypothetical protein